MSADRELARLKLIALIQELPIDADLTLDVKGLSREEYNGLPGQRQFSLGLERPLLWTKGTDDEGLVVQFWTSEPPVTDWDEVARGESLRVIPGGRA